MLNSLLSLASQSAHLAMTDTLMMAYTVEMVSVEKVIACAQQYAAFFQATDLPYDTEDAVTYWINKVGDTRLRKMSPIARKTESLACPQLCCWRLCAPSGRGNPDPPVPP